MYLQNKNENLEQENTLLRRENDELQKSKKLQTDERVRNRTLTQTKSHNIFRNKNDHMESLLKEQIECMKKMLVLVQEKKRNEIYEDSDSNLHFEESFNVTNMSENSVEAETM
jgi:hypothetical protein